MPPRRRTPPPAKAAARNRAGAEGSVWRRVTAHVTGRDRGICWICLHPGAAVADHVQPVAERPDLALDASNLKAAHGYLKSGGGECPACSAASAARGGGKIYCNELRQALSVERARRIIQERTGLKIGEVNRSPGERDW